MKLRTKKRRDLATAPRWLRSVEAIDCAGAGRCHGPQNWCDFCGDVYEVCDDSDCDQHWRIHNPREAAEQDAEEARAAEMSGSVHPPWRAAAS